VVLAHHNCALGLLSKEKLKLGLKLGKDSKIPQKYGYD